MGLDALLEVLDSQAECAEIGGEHTYTMTVGCGTVKVDAASATSAVDETAAFSLASSLRQALRDAVDWPVGVEEISAVTDLDTIDDDSVGTRYRGSVMIVFRRDL